jgi:hypothetical protein
MSTKPISKITSPKSSNSGSDSDIIKTPEDALKEFMKSFNNIIHYFTSNKKMNLMLDEKTKSFDSDKMIELVVNDNKNADLYAVKSLSISKLVSVLEIFHKYQGCHQEFFHQQFVFCTKSFWKKLKDVEISDDDIKNIGFESITNNKFNAFLVIINRLKRTEELLDLMDLLIYYAEVTCQLQQKISSAKEKAEVVKNTDKIIESNQSKV